MEPMKFLKSFFSNDKNNHSKKVKVNERGFSVLKNSILNKGPAFTLEEREALKLIGLIPSGVTTLEIQAKRAYEQYNSISNNLAKNVYLTALQDRNEVLFYKLLTEHLSQMLPIVYDPTVGLAIEKYSHEYRRPRGVYLSIDAPHKIEESFTNFGLGQDEVDLIVATDAEEILGIGDWGVGGIDIAVGKLAVYTAAAGIDPKRVIPVMLDVGTDNETLLNDPLYLGYRHSRIRDQRYDDFIDQYVKTAKKMFPKALLHWEDFGPSNGRRILLKYRNEVATFNDDMQGTGAITLAAFFNALKKAKLEVGNIRVVIFGAGTAGVGIADQLRDAMVRQGLTVEEATRQFWLIDKQGLLTESMQETLRDYQRPYARPQSEINQWKTLVRSGEDATKGATEGVIKSATEGATESATEGVIKSATEGATKPISLLDVVKEIHPTVLIGTSTASRAFNEEIIKEMAKYAEHPIIFPLSNPTPLSEADPVDLIQWTKGKALIATGSPFPEVEYQGIRYTIGQANNALLYPGLGLGSIVSEASKITDSMFVAAAEAVASLANLHEPGASLLPEVDQLRVVSATVAIAVAKAAIRDKVAHKNLKESEVVQAVTDFMWEPKYSNFESN